MLMILFIPFPFLKNTIHKRQLMKITLFKIFFILFIIAVFTGCKKNTVINEKQALLFQVDYVNYAWGYQHNGFIIDNEGKVDNLEKCVFSGKIIPSGELIKYVRYIKNISSSKVTAQKNVAADAGSLEYICYQFSETSGTYKGSLIKMEGDFTCENLNFYSKKVWTWLRSINDSIIKK